MGSMGVSGFVGFSNSPPFSPKGFSSVPCENKVIKKCETTTVNNTIKYQKGRR